MKRIIVAMLASIVSLSVIACGSSNTQTPEQTPSTETTQEANAADISTQEEDVVVEEETQSIVETETLTQEQYAYIVSADVPKDSGYEFQTEYETQGVNREPRYANMLLANDDIRIFIQQLYFSEEGRPESFDFYLNNEDLEKGQVGDAVAMGEPIKFGSSDSVEVIGYKYKVDVGSEDFFMEVSIYKSENSTIDGEKILENPEVQTIINSMYFTLK